MYAEAGGLIPYSANLIDEDGRAPPDLDKISKGAKPTDLLELVQDMRAAKALGPTIPASTLLPADQVIE